MKYLLLPIHLLKFWFIESLSFFARVWKNLMLFLEEDLAVGLMLRLLFIPLFHDSSIIGRVLSFFFRLFRVVIGVLAFSLATVAVVVLGFYWLALPALIIIGVKFLGFPRDITASINLFDLSIFFSGLGLFLIHVFTHPHKQVWQIKEENLWLASRVAKKKLQYKKLLEDSEVKNLLSYLEIAEESLSKLQNPESANVEEISKIAFQLARKGGSPYLRPVHFFIGWLSRIQNVELVLLKLNLSLSDFENAFFFFEAKANRWRVVWIWDRDFAIHHLKGVNRGWLGVPTPNLDLVSTDLTRMASLTGFDSFIGREAVVGEIVNILSQENGRNVILVAPPGSGKSALINFLAKQIIAGDAPLSLATKRLVSLDATRLLSNIHNQGELADRIRLIFDEVSFAQNIIIVIEEIHNLGIGEAGISFNLYSLLLPYIESSAFQFLGTTEPENYTQILENSGAFARLFTKVDLPQASQDETIRILMDRAIDIERRRKINVSYLSLKKTVELSSKLIHDRLLPDSALAILAESETRTENHWITTKTIEQVVAQRVNVPVMEIGTADRDRLLNLEGKIHQKLVDQEEAVNVVADTLRRGVTGIREGNRPIGSFLFVGPTGVGKTELAKILAEEYFFASSGAFIRFDMSEYQDPFAAEKLIGGPGKPGELTEAIRHKPYALLLLDEFEKASPAILTLFLQVLEDGRLTDGSGKTIDFTNTIIIATSNAGSLTIVNGLQQGQKLDQVEGQVSQELLQLFKPELVNRFDSIVLFKPLSQDDLQKIVMLHLVKLQDQLKEKGYLITFDGEVLSELGKRGYDPVLGARPLRRLIQDTLESKLSRLILENKLVKGEAFKVGVDLLS